VLLLTIILFLIPLIYGVDLDECSRHGTLTKDIPCVVISSFAPDVGCNQQANIYSNNTLIQSQNWTTGTPFCELEWNISTAGSYVYNSSIEDGVITITVEDNMLSNILVFILLVVYFTVIGFINMTNKQRTLSFLSYSMALVELLMMVAMLWIADVGDSVTNLLRLNFFIMLIIGGGIGLLSLFMFSLRMINVGDALEDKEDNKWQQEKWKI